MRIAKVVLWVDRLLERLAPAILLKAENLVQLLWNFGVKAIKGYARAGKENCIELVMIVGYLWGYKFT